MDSSQEGEDEENERKMDAAESAALKQEALDHALKHIGSTSKSHLHRSSYVSEP